MSIRDPQIAPYYGALDSGAVADGGSFSAHHHRALIRGVNHLSAQPRQLMSLFWPAFDPVVNPDGLSHYSGGNATSAWRRILPPVMMYKPPGHGTGAVRMTLAVDLDAKVQLQFVTRATAFSTNPALSNSLVVVGTGAAQHVDLDGLPLTQSAATEHLEVWIRSTSVGSLMNTATYGTRNSGDWLIVTQDYFADAASLWFSTSGRHALGDAGHEVAFMNAGYTQAVAVRELREAFQFTTGEALSFRPKLNDFDQRQIRSFAQNFIIREIPSFDLVSLAVASEGRTI